jgi:hypothetical protein
MFRRTDRTRLDRVLAAIEIPALGLWVGALCGFAFIFAPAAFHIVSDLTQFAALTSANLRALAFVGYACGGIAKPPTARTISCARCWSCSRSVSSPTR